MSDALHRLKRAFERQEPIRPRDQARKAAIDAALKFYTAENEAAAQGQVADRRLSEQEPERPVFNWRRLMIFPHINRTHILAGSASVAVLAIAMISLNRIQPDLILPPSPAPQPVIASDTASSPARTELPAMQVETVPQANDSTRKRSFRHQLSAKRDQSSSPDAAPQALMARAPLAETIPPVIGDQGRDRFADIDQNGVKLAAEDPVSTFSIDVDTASYAFMRGALNRGVLPPKDSVRVEELINYFDYAYAVPQNRDAPFAAQVSVMPTPWNEDSKLLQIGIMGFELPPSETPAANLVFLIDTSGSMNTPDKLPLLRNAFRLLLQSLQPDDTVAIVAYAGSAGTVLEPTKVTDQARILAALDGMQAGGSTAGAEGIRLAYQLAERNLDANAVNRVILATDGDFNVGITDRNELQDFVERKRAGGVSLSVLGFGHGNYNDELMQTLAQNGNGNAAYIDTLNEARKVLVEEAGSTLFTIAGDVKLQVEFNPATVAEYRLIGYETRLLNREDFNNDRVDAGDIGSGHTVTALYEFVPAGGSGALVDGLRYQQSQTAGRGVSDEEYAFVKIRYKLPGDDVSRLITAPVTDESEVPTIGAAPADSRFAAAVAGFGQLLTGGRYTGSWTYEDVIALAREARGEDPFGYRSEFISLARLAQSAAALEQLKQ